MIGRCSVRLWILLCTLALSSLAQAQTYQEVRSWGGGPPQVVGLFNYPQGIAVDVDGNLYVADLFNARVQKFTQSGQLIKAWGSAGSAEGQFYRPYGIAISKVGYVYVSDHTQIHVFTRDGVFVKRWGSSGTGDGQFLGAEGIAVDKNGNVFVTDRGGTNQVQKFSADGVFISKWGAAGNGDGQFSSPRGITVDDSGFVYVADAYNHRIQKFTSNGSFVTKWKLNDTAYTGSPRFYGITVDAQGNIYVCDTDNQKIKCFTSNGTLIREWGGVWGTGQGTFHWPQGIAVGKNGHLFITDDNCIVQEFTASGGFVTQWGVSVAIVIPPDDGKFNWPFGLAADTTRNSIYVLDRTDSRIQRFSLQGSFLGKWGTAGGGDSQFDDPRAIAVDTAGVVYVADNSRVQKFSSQGTYLGGWRTHPSGAGTLFSCRGIAVDKTGYIYAVDWTNRVQKFTTNGVYVLEWGTTGIGDGQFDLPRGIGVDNQGFVYVVDQGDRGLPSQIQKFTSMGTFVAKWTLGISTHSHGDTPALTGISFDRFNNVFVADDRSDRVFKFTSNRVLLSTWNGADVYGIALDKDGSVYATSGYFGDKSVHVSSIVGKDFSVPSMEISAPAVVRKGADFDVTLSIRDSLRVTSVFGLGFDIKFTNTTFVDFVSADTGGCYLGNNLLYLVNSDEANGKVSIALSRKAPASGVTGSGLVLKMKFRAAPSTPDSGQTVFSITNLSANDSAGKPITFNTVADTTTVTPNLNVWPGDADNSGLVNQNDILPLGLYWGKTGPVRSSATTQWLAQSAIPWTPPAATYADANGDGIVNQADVLPIGLNWGKNHSLGKVGLSLVKGQMPIQAIVLGTPVLRASGPSSVRGKTTFDVNIVLGDTLNPVSSLFGISFVLDFSSSKNIIQAMAVTPGSFLGNDIIFFPQIDNTNGTIAIGLTRKSGAAAVVGFGQVATMRFQVINNTSASSFSFTTRDITANDAGGNAVAIQPSSSSVLAAANETNFIPTEFHLEQNYPNPFNPSTKIAFAIPTATRVNLTILDLLGREVVTLVQGERTAGVYEVQWNASNSPSGIYFYRLQAGGFIDTKRMILLK